MISHQPEYVPHQFKWRLNAAFIHKFMTKYLYYDLFVFLMKKLILRSYLFTTFVQILNFKEMRSLQNQLSFVHWL